MSTEQPEVTETTSGETNDPEVIVSPPTTPIATVENLDTSRYPQGSMVANHQLRLPSGGVYLDDLKAGGQATHSPDSDGTIITPGGLVHHDVTTDSGNPYDSSNTTASAGPVESYVDADLLTDPVIDDSTEVNSQISGDDATVPTLKDGDTGTIIPTDNGNGEQSETPIGDAVQNGQQDINESAANDAS